MRKIAFVIAAATAIVLSGSGISNQAAAMSGATDVTTRLSPTDIGSAHRGHHRFHRVHARGPRFTPPGWHHGKKVGWRGRSRPPGLR